MELKSVNLIQLTVSTNVKTLIAISKNFGSNTMVKKLGLTFCFIIILSAIAYHFLTPKITLSNDSAKSYAALNFTLPSSQISFSPIPSQSRQSIYFSPQKNRDLSPTSLSQIKAVSWRKGNLTTRHQIS
ncbi:hypothetical protein Swoo_3002 [Shewanella woodyi ATCC 51908]|uniref:Uncharacterized protein n=1 Tax=Shewanella woodyi (strain ATCC 51908 / MS32) TaxID=392500 RepID=B1KKQ6_SHEWM|nr:hypothetical protein Swoo_3002 [Shewanella woodyi ATCC 51908]